MKNINITEEQRDTLVKASNILESLLLENKLYTTENIHEIVKIGAKEIIGLKFLLSMVNTLHSITETAE
jgi:hypothetical protein